MSRVESNSVKFDLIRYHLIRFKTRLKFDMNIYFFSYSLTRLKLTNITLFHSLDSTPVCSNHTLQYKNDKKKSNFFSFLNFILFFFFKCKDWTKIVWERLQFSSRINYKLNNTIFCCKIVDVSMECRNTLNLIVLLYFFLLLV